MCVSVRLGVWCMRAGGYVLSLIQDRLRKVAVAFWHNIDEPNMMLGVLPYAISKGLGSTEVAGFDRVDLLSFATFTNMPACVSRVDAREVMSYERFLALYNSGKEQFPVNVAPGKDKHLAHSPVICLIADFIRFKYAGKFTRDECDCVCIIDSDTLWLKEWISRGFMGFIFASCMANPSSYENKNPLARRIRFLREYGRTPGDMLSLTFPAQFATGHPILKFINDELLFMCPIHGRFPVLHDWRFVMHTFINAVNTHGLRDGIVAYHTFSSMHWYWRLKPLENLVILYMSLFVRGGGIFINVARGDVLLKR